MKLAKKSFDLYRYQILPVNRIQEGLFDSKMTVDELIRNKNILFEKAFQSIVDHGPHVYQDDREELRFQKIYPDESDSEDDFFIYQLAIHKNITIETKDFKTETVDNWPKSYLIVWNDPEKQIIALEHNYKASHKTDTLIKKIMRLLNGYLVHNCINTSINPIFKQQDFWRIVSEKDIYQIEFNLITPNMANISKTLSDELKCFARNTNTIETNLTLNSSDDNVLLLKRDDKTLSSLVEYSSQGGGEINVKIKGVRKKTSIGKNTKSISIDEMDLLGDPSNIKDVINSILNETDN